MTGGTGYIRFVKGSEGIKIKRCFELREQDNTRVNGLELYTKIFRTD